MKLDRVTITGADDSIRPTDLIELTQKYPFVEWGILVSRANMGQPRYPTQNWIEHLKSVVRTQPIQLSLHVCGHWVRQLLIGFNDLPFGIDEGFQRMQLNFHAEQSRCYPAAAWGAMKDLSPRQFIFQIDDQLGNKHFSALSAEAIGRGSLDMAPLFDISGGAGVTPSHWPRADWLDREGEQLLYHGYAGGLGPQNLHEQLPLIAGAAGNARYWIDMETHVRSEDDRQFDLAKVERCLQIAADFMSPPA